MPGDIDESDFIDVESTDTPRAYLDWPLGAPRPGISYEYVSPDFAGETFTYVVRDAMGATAIGTVHVLPAACGGTTTTTEPVSTTVTTTSTTSTTDSTLPPTTTSTTTAPPTARPRPLAGKTLVLKAKPLVLEKGSLVATLEGAAVDLGLGVGSADDPRLVGGALHLTSEAGDLDFVYTLPAANWTAKLEKGTVAGWTYKDAKRLAGPIGSIVVQPGKSVVVKGKGADLGFQLPNDPKPVRVSVVIGDGALRYCGLFGGTTSFKPGTQFKATKAPAPAGCDE